LVVGWDVPCDRRGMGYGIGRRIAFLAHGLDWRCAVYGLVPPSKSGSDPAGGPKLAAGIEGYLKDQSSNGAHVLEL
jgi:hypothetical protein